MHLVRASLKSRRPGAWVGATDVGSSAPIAFLADNFWRVPHSTDPSFESKVFEICRTNAIGLIIPTIDPELGIYARCREKFAKEGITVCVSSEAVVEIAADKARTHSWLLENGLPTVRQASPSEVLREPTAWRWPLIAKPRNGSASVGVRRVEDVRELLQIAETEPACIVQEFARGREFTINFFVNQAGRCVCAVPHWRMEVRSGEVSKGLTAKNPKLMQLCERVAEALPGARGPLNVQCFVDEDGVLAIIEINARFGGGYPLAHQAGAHFTDWLLDEQDGREVPCFDGWTDDLAMLRYDDAVFVPGKSVISA